MAKKIVILEDNADRRDAMRRCLEDRFYQFETAFFDEPAGVRTYLEAHWRELAAIGLDHDLELKIGADGRAVDLGTGREIADFLAHREPACHVVIHTTNTTAALAMETLLRDARW